MADSTTKQCFAGVPPPPAWRSAEFESGFNWTDDQKFKWADNQEAVTFLG
jgi:hypothetical protein